MTTNDSFSNEENNNNSPESSADRKRRKELERMELQRSFDLELIPIVNRLKEVGAQGSTIQEIVRNHAPLTKRYVEILLDSLSAIQQPRVVETVIRALAATKCRIDGSPLVDWFKKTNETDLKWAILNTIAIIKPKFIEDWLVEIEKHPYWGKVLEKLR